MTPKNSVSDVSLWRILVVKQDFTDSKPTKHSRSLCNLLEEKSSSKVVNVLAMSAISIQHGSLLGQTLLQSESVVLRKVSSCTALIEGGYLDKISYSARAAPVEKEIGRELGFEDSDSFCLCLPWIVLLEVIWHILLCLIWCYVVALLHSWPWFSPMKKGTVCGKTNPGKQGGEPRERVRKRTWKFPVL